MNYYKVKDMLCNKLQELSMIDNPSMTDIEKIHVVTDTIKNIGKIEMQEGGYSQRGYSRDGYSQGVYSNDYGNSYANRGQHYVRGHYSRAMEDEMYSMIDDPNMSSSDKETLRKALALMR